MAKYQRRLGQSTCFAVASDESVASVKELRVSHQHPDLTDTIPALQEEVKLHFVGGTVSRRTRDPVTRLLLFIFHSVSVPKFCKIPLFVCVCVYPLFMNFAI